MDLCTDAAPAAAIAAIAATIAADTAAADADAVVTPPLLPHDVLVRVFQLLPVGVLAVTPGRVCRDWAAAKAEAWKAAAAALPLSKIDQTKDYVFLPEWYARDTFDHGSHDRKERVVYAAAFHGQVDVLRRLHEVDPVCFGDDSVGKRACQAAAEGGQLATLQFLRERGCRWCARTCSAAAAAGHVHILAWCVEQGCLVDVWTCWAAAQHGRIEVLEWCLARDLMPLDAQACAFAVGHRQWPTLRWLREHAGAPWDRRTCSGAARSGDLEMLRDARERGCPWDERQMCEIAAEHGHLHVLKHCVEQGCPIDVVRCLKLSRDFPACQEWLKAMLPLSGA